MLGIPLEWLGWVMSQIGDDQSTAAALYVLVYARAPI